jgi:hypothetical protein
MSPDEELARFIGKYSPEVAALAEAALAKMRKRLPGAVELVYDNYNALAIAFGPSERLGDVIFSITLYPRWVSLFFKQGAKLPDPQKLLKGTGTAVRHIVLDGCETLDRPAVRKLMDHALKAGRPFERTAARRTIIKSVVANQRSRRPK